MLFIVVDFTGTALLGYVLMFMTLKLSFGICLAGL